jgi:hypothetical protein
MRPVVTLMCRSSCISAYPAVHSPMRRCANSWPLPVGCQAPFAARERRPPFKHLVRPLHMLLCIRCVRGDSAGGCPLERPTGLQVYPWTSWPPGQPKKQQQLIISAAACPAMDLRLPGSALRVLCIGLLGSIDNQHARHQQGWRVPRLPRCPSINRSPSTNLVVCHSKLLHACPLAGLLPIPLLNYPSFRSSGIPFLRPLRFILPCPVPRTPPQHAAACRSKTACLAASQAQISLHEGHCPLF